MLRTQSNQFNESTATAVVLLQMTQAAKNIVKRKNFRIKHSLINTGIFYTHLMTTKTSKTKGTIHFLE